MQKQSAEQENLPCNAEVTCQCRSTEEIAKQERIAQILGASSSTCTKCGKSLVGNRKIVVTSQNFLPVTGQIARAAVVDYFRPIYMIGRWLRAVCKK